MIECTDVLDRYAYMWKLSRSRWAWEVLRRIDEFREEALRHGPDELQTKEFSCGVTLIRPLVDQTAASRWGLAFFPDPDKNAIDADVFWSDALYPRKVTVRVVPRGPGEVDEIFLRTIQACKVKHFTDLHGREQLLIKGEGCTAQIRCKGLSLVSSEPVKMDVVIEGMSDYEAKLKNVERARAVCEGRGQPEQPRWTQFSWAMRTAMIALDCQREGLGIFETACVLHGRENAQKAWDGASDAMRMEVTRALKRARKLIDGGYRDLLMAKC